MSFETPGDGVRCDHCNQPGVPYTYQGREFSGLIANQGERLCSTCNGRAHDTFVSEAVEAAPAAIWIPAELRGVDGRDAAAAARRLVRKNKRGN